MHNTHLVVELLGADLHLLSFSLATTLLILGKLGRTRAVSHCLLLHLHLGSRDVDGRGELLALDVVGNQLRRTGRVSLDTRQGDGTGEFNSSSS